MTKINHIYLVGLCLVFGVLSERIASKEVDIRSKDTNTTEANPVNSAVKQSLFQRITSPPTVLSATNDKQAFPLVTPPFWPPNNKTTPHVPFARKTPKND